MNTLRTELFNHKLLVTANLSKTKNAASANIARSLDVALMSIGFKLSKDLMVYISELSTSDALKECQFIVDSAQKLVGDHVKHNPYFKKFPKGVPDTLEFWSGLINQYYEQDGAKRSHLGLTYNLLDLPGYGTVQHSYEEMLDAHKDLKVKKNFNIKMIHLGKSEQEEFVNFFCSMASSKSPLSPEDRIVLDSLIGEGYSKDIDVPVRENKAIVNAANLKKGLSIRIDTVVDILRMAMHMSSGDVTLATNSKFTSFGKAHRRQMILALDDLVKRNSDKIDDASPYKERFKRLAEKLHPRDFKGAKNAHRLFDYCAGSEQINTFNARVHQAIVKRDVASATEYLSDRPGYLIKNLDFLIRNSNKKQLLNLELAVKNVIGKVSTRNIITAYTHLLNREKDSKNRIFINKEGKAHVELLALKPLTDAQTTDILLTLQRELTKRMEKKFENKQIMMDNDAFNIALPLSEKTKAEGLDVLPRGSEFNISPDCVVRFFMYWKEKSQRTDYDLSVCSYDKNFKFIGQVSWTNLKSGDMVHSGDITSAPNGATEFIDIKLDKILAGNVCYLVPSINLFAGEAFADVEENFFGFMERPNGSKGQPFEAKTVKTKFSLRGSGKVAMPLVFCRTKTGLKAKWVDLYAAGQEYGNRVEAHKLTTAMQAQSIVERDYFTVGQLMGLAPGNFVKEFEDDKPSVFIGIHVPEKLPKDCEIFSLNDFKNLIP